MNVGKTAHLHFSGRDYFPLCTGHVSLLLNFYRLLLVDHLIAHSHRLLLFLVQPHTQVCDHTPFLLHSED